MVGRDHHRRLTRGLVFPWAREKEKGGGGEKRKKKRKKRKKSNARFAREHIYAADDKWFLAALGGWIGEVRDTRCTLSPGGVWERAGGGGGGGDSDGDGDGDGGRGRKGAEAEGGGGWWWMGRKVVRRCAVTDGPYFQMYYIPRYFYRRLFVQRVSKYQWQRRAVALDHG